MTDTHDTKKPAGKAKNGKARKRRRKARPKPERNDEARMTFTEHLAELRTRIIRSGVALIVCMGVCYFISDYLYELVVGPLKNADISWEALNLVEGFSTKLRLAGYGGFIVALPYIIYHICAFVFPGLKPNERRLVGTMLTGGTILFVSGVVLAHRGILPIVLEYLVKFTPPDVDQKLRLSENVALLFKFYLAFGVAFQFPLAVLALVYLELLDPAMLRAYRRFVIVGIAVAAAILTPPDPISMVLMATPLVILYEMSIWLSYVIVGRRNRRRAKEEKRERERRAEARKKAKPAQAQKPGEEPKALPDKSGEPPEEQNTD